MRRCYADRDISQQSLGFIRTIFRKRFGSSTYAFAQTLRNAAERKLEDNDDWTTMLNDADLGRGPRFDRRRPPKGQQC